MPRNIKIASRTSRLALWQSNTVKAELEKLGSHCEIVPVETTGDVNLKQPLYELGVIGIFTKQLDISILNNQADIAVHSLKDVPTQLAEGLVLAAVLERGAFEDVVAIKNKDVLNNTGKATIATGSLRRKAQWLSKYPNHTIVPIRGNVQTRLKKYSDDNSMNGVIFAKAGLERLGLLTDNTITLDWMLPAPAQGIIGIVCRKDDLELVSILEKINHKNTFIAGQTERQFLKTLMGGCSVPISALAKIKNGKIEFKGAVHSFNGKESFIIEEKFDLNENAGAITGKKILQQKGAKELIEIIRNKKWDETSSVRQETE
jgi:hydroxymethylbilane synthase